MCLKKQVIEDTVSKIKGRIIKFFTTDKIIHNYKFNFFKHRAYTLLLIDIT